MHNTGDSEDSEIDVCSVDDEITSVNHTGLTLVAAETYVSNNHNYEEQLVPLTSDDLLTRNKVKSFHGKSKHSKNNQNGKKFTHREKVGNTDSNDNLTDKYRLHVNQHKVVENVHGNYGNGNGSNIHDKDKYSYIPTTQTTDKHNGKHSGEAFCYDKDDIKKEDSDEEFIDRGINECLNRFHFESDHLAIKNNADYHALLQTLTLLEAQRTQAIKDLEMLHVLKDEALGDPLKFVQNLQEGKLNEFPARQVVVKLPEINWIHYMMAYSGDKYVPQITTRKAVKTQEPDIKTETIDMDCWDDNSMDGLSGESFSKFKSKIDGKPATHKLKWSTEEQEKLEKLLLLYPPEEIEARRWEKIAKALGTRTPQQVSSRIQKYFLKLAKAKLPIPGRGPSGNLLNQCKKSKINPVNYKNSSFFPSWRPNVYMSDDDREEIGGDFLDDKPENYSISDEEESVPDELKQTPEYKELMQLKKIKKYRALKEENQSKPEFHKGYMCDGCKLDPIIGVRWHCMQCPVEQSTDFCNNCAQSCKPLKSSVHTSDHQLMPVYKPLEADLDNDYLAFEQRNKFKYNYLDPNFIPCR